VAGGGSTAAQIEKVVERIVERPLRRRLNDTRRSVTHKFNVAGHEGYLTVGLYDNSEPGEPGELFITMAKEGSTIGGLMDSLGTAISIALQYGVPVEALVNKFTHQRFEPAGMTHNPDIPLAKSLVDYIFRWMGMEFISGYREANAPRRQGAAGAAKSSAMSGAPSPGPESPSAAEPSGPTVRASANNVAAGDTAVSGGASRDTAAGSQTDDQRDRGRGNGREHAKQMAAESSRPLGHRVSTAWSGRVLTEVPAPRDEPQNVQSDELRGDSAHATMTTVLKEMQADAPACDVCGTITVRSGTCYKCLNCGNSMGCS